MAYFFRAVLTGQSLFLREISGIELILFTPIVTEATKAGWEEYAENNQGWVEEGIKNKYKDGKERNPGSISTSIYPLSKLLDEDTARRTLGRQEALAESATKFHLPVWTHTPSPDDATIVNLDLYSHPQIKTTVDDVLDVKHSLLSPVIDFDFFFKYTNTKHMSDQHPRSLFVEAVKSDFTNSSNIVGLLFAELEWEVFFENVLPEHMKGMW